MDVISGLSEKKKAESQNRKCRWRANSNCRVKYFHRVYSQPTRLSMNWMDHGRNRDSNWEPLFVALDAINHVAPLLLITLSTMKQMLEKQTIYQNGRKQNCWSDIEYQNMERGGCLHFIIRESQNKGRSSNEMIQDIRTSHKKCSNGAISGSNSVWCLAHVTACVFFLCYLHYKVLCCLGRFTAIEKPTVT